MPALKPILFLILDGYGLAPAGPGNAASIARTPTLDRLFSMPEMGRLDASGRQVGLPSGFIGNSEVGHLNIGAGRIVYQDMTRIDMAVESGELFRNPVLLDMCERVRARKGRIHFCGLLSDGGVHSHIRHLFALLELAQREGIPALVHAFLDGRDTPPCSGVDYIAQLEPVLKKTGARLADMVGRFYAMDRDKRWERVEQAWNMLVHGQGQRVSDATQALRDAYAEGETDEFLKPRILLDPSESVIRDGDGVFCFNFRADRGRELVRALTDPDFTGFDRGAMPDMAAVASMTSYEASLTAPVAFTKDNLHKTMGELVSSMGLRQLRIAETEKYAHVTYFFSGGREIPFENEDRILVESPRDVATYDLKPQMSAEEVTDKLIAAWNSGKYDFVVCNLANPDMVGHTGVLEAAVKACETVDACVTRIEKAVLDRDGILCITADHGNVEKMIDEEGRPQTAHTLNQTPLLIVEKGKSHPVADGKLGDIMPTLLTLWGVPVPAEMTGNNLLI
ncbi:2,3-bisphosphoglycerate-independent phosphoglycerate mutase [Mailhella sp.]|uniref:2,3-bisphosphoglycerate-independent phosphoglycerate mutase n=1 Tax=Mailhella sp. TaxID=1981029 RepID=UPI003AB41462